MATVFWDSQGIILIDYLEMGKSITGVEEGNHQTGGVGGGYGTAGARSQSSGSSSGSPPTTSTASMLIVPHPLGPPSAKVEAQHHVVTQNGSGRKYQCKMCPSKEF
uniref:Uncharacterized protein n=1 Tax=Rhodnius prolixus TaxID=13249 RepID=T1I2Y5_RHOPR